MFDDHVRVGRDLKSAVRNAGHTQEAVARAFGVSQPWISRIFNGQFRDRTDLAMRLCERYSVAPHAHDDASEFDDLVLRLRELWDGTPAGIKRLRALLNAVIEIERSAGDAAGGHAGPATDDVRATGRPKA